MGVSIPDEFRGEMALAGDWQTTSITPIQQPEEDGEGKPIKSIGVRKRKHEGGEGGEGEEDEEQNEEHRFVSKGWGSRTREYPGAREDNEDLDALLASTKSVKKAKPTKEEEEEEGTTKKEPADDVPAAATTTTIKGEDDTAAAPEANQPLPVKEESSSAAPVKSEREAEEPAGVVFKKRKPKAIRK